MKIPGKLPMLFATPVLMFLSLYMATASPITRLDIYDKSDNQLLFVTFDYNSSGKNISRSVFASDSTFLRTTTFVPTGAGSSENSVDFLDNPVFTTSVSLPVANKTQFSTVDRFGLTQFGTALSHQGTSPNTFAVSQNGTSVCTEQYEFGADSQLNRITVLDKTGSLAWYALVTHQASGVIYLPELKTLRSVRITADRGVIRIQMDLAKPGEVRAELYTISGRKAFVLADKKYGAGRQVIAATPANLGEGTYLVLMTVNGVTVQSGKLLMER